MRRLVPVMIAATIASGCSMAKLYADDPSEKACAIKASTEVPPTVSVPIFGIVMQEVQYHLCIGQRS